MDKDICVGTTDIKTIENPQPGIAIGESLKRKGYKVIGIDDAPLTAALVLPFFDNVYILPKFRNYNLEFLKREFKKLRKKENLKIFIPGYDTDVHFFSKHREEFEEIGIKMLLPSLNSLNLSSKQNLSKLREHNIEVPTTFKVKDRDALKKISKKLEFPLMVKGLVKGAYIAKNTKDILFFYEKIKQDPECGKTNEILLQEFIKGSIFSIAGVVDSKSRLVRSVQMKKLAIDSKGTTWAGYTVKEEILEKITRKIIKIINWTGPFEFEFVKEKNTGKFFLIEINPRLPAWIHLATMAGQNFPEAIVRICLGEKIKVKRNYKVNLFFTRVGLEVTFPLKYILNSGNGIKIENLNNKDLILDFFYNDNK